MQLLLVDDEPNVLYSFEKGLKRCLPNLELVTSETGAEALRLVDADPPDAILLDVRLPDTSGLKVFEKIQERDTQIPVIIITAHSTTDTAINAMKRGAFDYLIKPVDIHRLCDLVSKALELSRLRQAPALFEVQGDSGADSSSGKATEHIVGRSPLMQEVYKSIGRVAQEDVTVLIRGESGTGKELVARAIYHHSQRVKAPFMAINCAALPESLLESELFGHERGAFTGADNPRIGKFEQTHGGTLFLDELGDMSLATQAKVLRVLQDGCFERVGSNTTIQTDVRVIAATNQDLEGMIRSGSFRKDLLYRLNGFTIHLPPLRERRDDLPLLIEHLVKQCNRQLSKQVTKLAPETMTLLESYDWPGNVRELYSVVKYAVVHTVGEIITPECLPESCFGQQTSREFPQTHHNELGGLAHHIQKLLHDNDSNIYRLIQDEVDRLILQETLSYVRGNQVHASQMLGMSRTTLRNKLEQLGMQDMDFSRIEELSISPKEST